jgi:hypothetical protein
MLVGICFEVKKKEYITNTPHKIMEPGKKRKKMYNFLKQKVNFKKTVLVIRCYFLVLLYSLLTAVKAFACRQWTVFMHQL